MVPPQYTVCFGYWRYLTTTCTKLVYQVLFTFLAERYERRSVVITSNLSFSEWDQIFKNPLTTAAAIDRVVHHSIIIEFGHEMKSVRAEEAARHNSIRLGGTSAAHDAED